MTVVNFQVWLLGQQLLVIKKKYFVILEIKFIFEIKFTTFE